MKAQEYLKRSFGYLNVLNVLKKQLQKEQKELFFNKKSWEDEVDYFNFIKFLFTNPGKI
jgi:hypothetical protein